MKNANVRDAVAIIELAATLEEGILKGEQWDELKVAEALKGFRKQQKYFKPKKSSSKYKNQYAKQEVIETEKVVSRKFVPTK